MSIKRHVKQWMICSVATIGFSSFPFFGKSLYRKSLKPCSSGKYYCQLALNEARTVVESTKFPDENCDSRGEVTPELLWTFSRVDPEDLQNAAMWPWLDMVNLENYGYQIRNVGADKLLCIGPGARPYLCDTQDGLWDLVTWGKNGRNSAYGERWGYLIAGNKDETVKDNFMTAPDNNQIIEGDKYNAHYWILERAGYNVYRFVYGNDDPQAGLCATALGLQVNSNLELQPCAPYNPLQYWTITKA